jgi:hypothetical protein
MIFKKNRIYKAVFALTFIAALIVASAAHAINAPKTATTSTGEKIKITGSVVVIEPDIELSLITAGGLPEPRKEWSDAARRLYPLAVKNLISGKGAAQKPDYDVPDNLDPNSRQGQILRLNQAVAFSIAQYSVTGSVLATKKDPKTGKVLMDWSLGEGVVELQQATGADYALFTYVRDSYSSGGRTALRIFAMLAGAAVGSYVDIGGGQQIGVATLVDLRTGQVVWHNVMAKQSGDLRDEKGTKATVDQLLKGLPL